MENNEREAKNWSKMKEAKGSRVSRITNPQAASEDVVVAMNGKKPDEKQCNVVRSSK